MRSSGGIDLRHIDLEKVGLEIEGLWDRSGSFAATDVEVLGGRRRPKLRGDIQAIDPERQSVTVFGTPIRILSDTEFIDSPPGSGIETLRLGQRVEITCRNAPL